MDKKEEIKVKLKELEELMQEFRDKDAEIYQKFLDLKNKLNKD